MTGNQCGIRAGMSGDTPTLRPPAGVAARRGSLLLQIPMVRPTRIIAERIHLDALSGEAQTFSQETTDFSPRYVSIFPLQTERLFAGPSVQEALFVNRLPALAQARPRLPCPRTGSARGLGAGYSRP